MTGLEISHQLRDIAASVAYLRPAEVARERLLALADIAMRPESPGTLAAARSRILQLERTVGALQGVINATAPTMLPAESGRELMAAKRAILERLGLPAGTKAAP